MKKSYQKNQTHGNGKSGIRRWHAWRGLQRLLGCSVGYSCTCCQSPELVPLVRTYWPHVYVNHVIVTVSSVSFTKQEMHLLVDVFKFCGTFVYFFFSPFKLYLLFMSYPNCKFYLLSIHHFFLFFFS